MVGEILIPRGALKFILFQRTNYLRIPESRLYDVVNRIIPVPIYAAVVGLEALIFSSRIRALYEKDIRNEYLSIKNHLPEKCTTILDIGCGAAGIDVFLSYHYKRSQPKFYLLDKTYLEKNIWYGMKEKGAFYNSLIYSKKMLLYNGVQSSRVETIEATDDNQINVEGNVDLIISLISWGFHYPLETYLDRVFELLSEGGSLILDIRKGINGIDMVQSLFGSVSVVLDQAKYQRVLAIK